ncbi:hypothetical protein V4D30_06720 [Thermodesulfovibrio sp. 3907-1M]|uniref:GspL periplasmic domain-containing protein n=1 Tax=Thermodesulfovibrio autotrophicus TaxID=3118333 RepID=A0AAU8GXK7_9BACT
MKKVYLSIEGNIVKAVIPKKGIENAEFSEFSRDEIFDFVKENSIKELYISVSFSDLYTFKFSLPFQIPEKKKILEKLTFNEIRKRYPSLQQFSFIYEKYETEARSWIRCYVVPESSYQFIEELIEAKVNIKALYPMHVPLISLINSDSQLAEKNKVVCFISGKSRFLFIFEKSEMLLMREFEGSEDLAEEDIMNINMTVNYAIQNLRVTPEEIIFIGTKHKEVSGLILPHRFLSVLLETQEYTLPLSMVLFEESLKKRSILPKSYRRFKKTTKYLNYAGFFLIITAVILSVYNLEYFYRLKSLYSSLLSQRQYILQHEQEFVNVQQIMKKFETELKPFVELQNKRNSMIDTRYIIMNISQSKTGLIQLDSLEILNSEKPEIKIKGKSTGKSFSERQSFYLNFKSSLSEKGFKITSENWDITKGELSLNAVYEHPGILQ